MSAVHNASTPNTSNKDAASNPPPAAAAKKRAARKSLTYANARKSSGASVDGAKPKAQRMTKAGEAFKTRRFHPGTLAGRQVKFYQKKSGSLLQRAPMVKMLREVMDKIKKDMGLKDLRIDEKSKNMLIEYLETEAVRVLRTANTLAGRVAGRVTVFSSDLQTALSVLQRGF
jgi:histone H3-like centromeric protein A